MMAPYSNEEIKDWAESLRDQVSRISGRKKGGIPGFNSELKGELLDAIDLLVEHASEDNAPDPFQSALEEIRQQLVASAKQQQESLHTTAEELLNSIVQQLVEEQLCTRLDDLALRNEALAQRAETALGSFNAGLESQGEHTGRVLEQLGQLDEQHESWKESLSEQNVAASLQLEEIKALLQSFESKLAEPSNTADLNEQLSGLHERLEEANDVERRLREEMSELRLSKVESESRRRELEARALELETLCERLERRCNDFAERVRELELRNQKYESQIEILGERKALAEQARREQQASSLEIQAKYEGLQAGIADLEKQLTDLEQANLELEAENKRLTQEGEGRDSEQAGESTREYALEVRNESLESQLQELEQRNRELETNLVEMETQTQDIENRLRAEADENGDGDQELRDAHESMQRELTELKALLEEVDNEKRELEEKVASLQDQESRNLDSDNDDVRALEAEVHQLRAELSEVNHLLEESLAEGESKALASKVEELTDLLSQSREELSILQDQNSDLAAQLARHQVLNKGSEAHFACDEENLSWEDRKRLIMQQFADDEKDEHQRRLEVEQILASTEQALAHKTREIEELKKQLEESGPKDISPIEQDEIIQQEREKLKKIQKEWEEKLRQAEIDLSTERAKLARERSEIEERLAGKKNNDEEKEGAKTRKWLDHLGLRDNKKG